MVHSPCFDLPLLVSPLYPLLLTWNPPSCDRNRSPQSQVACKLTPLVPHLAPVPSPPEFQPLLGFPEPNMHLIRATLQTQPSYSRTICMYVCMYVCMYIYIYIYIYILGCSDFYFFFYFSAYTNPLMVANEP